MKKAIPFIVAIVLVIGAGIGVYLWQQNTIDNKDERINSLQSQLDTAQREIQDSSNGQQTVPDQQTDSSTYKSEKGVSVRVYTPESNSTVTSPTAIVGEVPGNWSFEADFPVQLQDSEGTVVAEGTATLLGDWMTEDLVPFSAKLTYSGDPSGSGSLVLIKDNPSGLDENSDSVSVPIKF